MPLQTMPVTVILVVAPTSVGVERRVLAAAVTATVGNLAPTRHSSEYEWSEILVAYLHFFPAFGAHKQLDLRLSGLTLSFPPIP